ncbi:SCP-like protein [Ancylostoma ceylanicum]|uniref:SCP-like protein n=1 Tax=Ancylostoma ceylanicum TaxID=53326 RepID=A0A0D6LIQ8_9BILA|nr:SCP-like protein [Ancylostoma ceylanicum]
MHINRPFRIGASLLFNMILESLPITLVCMDLSHNTYCMSTSIGTCFRSTVAKGKGYNGIINYTPTAANILKMTYDCTLEAAAIAHAKKCSGNKSKPVTRPGVGENIIEINKMYLTMPEVARQATLRWWRELSMYGVNAQMFFDSAIQQKNTVNHFTQMIWHSSKGLGCGIHNCGKFFFVVCQYTPRSTVAEGKGLNGNIGFTPPAANMLRMVTADLLV